MTKKEKLILKFKNNPIALKFYEIELVLIDLWFERIDAKWSHVKFKNKILKSDIIIPVHNNDCKDFYKKQVLKTLKFYSLI